MGREGEGGGERMKRECVRALLVLAGGGGERGGERVGQGCKRVGR